MVKRWILRRDGVRQRYNVKNIKKFNKRFQKFERLKSPTGARLYRRVDIKREQLVRVWAKIDYRSERGRSHNIDLEALMQKKILWSQRFKLMEELRDILEFGDDVAVMLEFGVERMDTPETFKKGEFSTNKRYTIVRGIERLHITTGFTTISRKWNRKSQQWI